MPSLTRGTTGCVGVPASGSACVAEGQSSVWMQLRGSSTVRCREGSFVLRRGDWIVLDRASKPCVQTDPLAICMGLNLAADTLDALGDGASPLYPGRGRMCRDEIRIAVRLWRRTGVVLDGRVAVRDDLHPLLLLVADLQRNIAITADRCPGRSLKQRATLMASLQRTRLYLEGQPLVDHKVDDLARFAGLPARYLSKVFHAIHGLPPLSFAGRVRLDHAARLLRDGGITVDQVAVICGYKHRGTLVAALRAHLGLGRMERIGDHL